MSASIRAACHYLQKHLPRRRGPLFLAAWPAQRQQPLRPPRWTQERTIHTAVASAADTEVVGASSTLDNTKPPPSVPTQRAGCVHRVSDSSRLLIDLAEAPSDVQPAPALLVSQLDIRVGKILEVAKHPDADRCATQLNLSPQTPCCLVIPQERELLLNNLARRAAGARQTWPTYHDSDLGLPLPVSGIWPWVCMPS